MASDSRIINALLTAAHNGKKITVVIGTESAVRRG
ncbi:MAG: hypothetical protein WDN75_19435 [Bacteroidota bacterium]